MIWLIFLVIVVFSIWLDRKYLVKGGSCPTCGKWRNR